MAHKKGGGSTRNGRDSKAKRLGVKVFGDAAINAGGIMKSAGHRQNYTELKIEAIAA